MGYVSTSETQVTAAPNPHRVLKSDGTVSLHFAWIDEDRTGDPLDLLTEEGVTFDEDGRAHSESCLAVEDLVALLPGSTD